MNYHNKIPQAIYRGCTSKRDYYFSGSGKRSDVYSIVVKATEYKPLSSTNNLRLTIPGK